MPPLSNVLSMSIAVALILLGFFGTMIISVPVLAPTELSEICKGVSYETAAVNN